MITSKSSTTSVIECVLHSDAAKGILERWTKRALQESNPTYRDAALRIGWAFARIEDSLHTSRGNLEK